MKEVRLGIIGIGTMGLNYARWVDTGRVERMRLTAICDTDPSRFDLCKQELNSPVKTFVAYEELLASGLVDAVMIAVPHYQHTDIAIKALRHRLHVILEKPAGIHASAVKEVNDEAQKHPDLVFAMMFNQRANPLYARVKDLMDRGVIGKVRRVTWTITTWWRTQQYFDSSTWRATWGGEGGGVLVNQAPHQIDLLQWLVGMPTSVRSFIKYGSQRDISVDDDVITYFEYENGAVGLLDTCTHDPLGTDRLEIFGNLGKIVIDDSSKLTVRTLTKSEEEFSRTLNFRQSMAIKSGSSEERLYSEEVLEIPERWDQQHIDALINFAEAILDGSQLVAPGAEGIKSVEFVNAMYLSSWLDKTVTIPVDPALFAAELDKRIEDEK